jgi:hypothetical protein
MPAFRWLLLVAILISVPVAAEEVVRDGVTYVLSTETPRDGTVELEPEFLWERGDDSDDIFFGVVPRIFVDEAGGEIYVLDSQLHEVMVFDMGGEFLRSIGREGEGPGEFRNPGDMYLAPDGEIGVMQVFPGRIVQLTSTGEPGRAFDAGNFEGFKVFHLSEGIGDRIVLSGTEYGGGADGGSQTDYLKGFAADGQELAEYYSETSPVQFGGMAFVESEFSNFTRRWAASSVGRVAVGRSFDNYQVHVHDADGNLLYVIERPDYKPVKRSGKEKDRFQRLYDAITSWNQGSTFQVSDTHQVVAQLNFRSDGTLWVMSGAGRWKADDGVMGVWDVYDSEGRYIKEVRVKGEGSPSEDGYFFVGDRIYQVTDLFSAAMSQIGMDEEGDTREAPEPVRLVAWKLEASLASR